MASYNRGGNGQSVRIGNWFEENKLQQETGVRYYPSPNDRQKGLLTRDRIITHTDQILPKDYTTVIRSTVVDPRQHPEFRRETSHKGPRQLLMEQTMKQMIDDEVERKTTADFRESRKFTVTTQTHESFTCKTNAHFAPTLRLNDTSVRMPTKSTNYSTDSAITFYSQAVSDPSIKVSFPTTFVGSINPFRKNANFSADIRSTLHNLRTETNERPKPLPTVTEFKALNALRAKLFAQAGKLLSKRSQCSVLEVGATTRLIVDTLIGPDNDFLPLLQLERLLFEEFNGLQLNAAERDAILSAFDVHNNNQVSVGDLCLFIRRTPVPRRLELINLFFSKVAGDLHEEGQPVAIQSLKALVQRNRSVHLKYCIDYFEQLNGASQSFTVEDFFDYFSDASSELDNDEDFERHLIDTFN